MRFKTWLGNEIDIKRIEKKIETKNNTCKLYQRSEIKQMSRKRGRR